MASRSTVDRALKEKGDDACGHYYWEGQPKLF